MRVHQGSQTTWKRSFTFSSRGKVREFDQKWLKSGLKSEHLNDPRKKVASLLYLVSIPNIVRAG